MKKRNTEIDIMKGIAILCVMIGHSSWLPANILTIICSFHMPLFFLISGYFQKTHEEVHQNWGGYIRNNAKQLIIPYAVVACVSCIWGVFSSIYKSDGSIFVHVLASNVIAWDSQWGIFDHWEGPTWFLLALFWARLFFYWLSKTGKWLVPLCICLSISMILIHPYLPMPFGIGRGIESLIFIALGWAYQRRSIPKWMVWGAIICWPISIWLGRIDMWSYHYNCLPIDILGACGATLIIYLLSKGIGRTFMKPFFSWCGRNSLIILCAHSMEYNITLIKYLVLFMPFKLPCMFLDGIKHFLAISGAWIYLRCTTECQMAYKE